MVEEVLLGTWHRAEALYLIHCNSQSAINPAKNSNLHSKFKYIDVHYH